MDAYLDGVQRVVPRAPTLPAMPLANFRSAPVAELAQAMAERRVAAYEEDVIEDLVDDRPSPAAPASQVYRHGTPTRA